MEVKEAIEQRRSIRKFKSKSVNKDDIDQILEAGRLAPSGTNLQPWRFVVIESDKMRNQLGKCTLDFVGEAPVTIACCIDLNALKTRKRRVVELYKAGAFTGTELENMDSSSYKVRKMDPKQAESYLKLNCAIAVENMVLQATELGLGSCWVMMFNQEKLANLLNLDDNLKLVTLLPIGYPEQQPEPRPRLSLDEVVIDRV